MIGGEFEDTSPLSLKSRYTFGDRQQRFGTFNSRTCSACVGRVHGARNGVAPDKMLAPGARDSGNEFIPFAVGHSKVQRKRAECGSAMSDHCPLHNTGAIDSRFHGLSIGAVRVIGNEDRVTTEFQDVATGLIRRFNQVAENGVDAGC
jgi:hypothetical protein